MAWHLHNFKKGANPRKTGRYAHAGEHIDIKKLKEEKYQDCLRNGHKIIFKTTGYDAGVRACEHCGKTADRIQKDGEEAIIED